MNTAIETTNKRPLTITTVDRFLSRVDRSGSCWQWTGGLDKDGYGILAGSFGEQRRAHRVAYELANDAPPGDLTVCHKCDNRKCVRPEHLFLGTAADNVADMMTKGRHRAASGNENGSRTKPQNLRRGVDHGIAKLNDTAVRDIRKAIAAGQSKRSIARQYGVGASAIHKINIGLTWRHVE